MIQTFISRRHTDDLILLFAGWGMDTHPFAYLSHIGCDCCVCYDYTDLNFDTTPFLDYKNIEVYAWSFGVWAAATVLPDKGLPIRHATAINGTEHGNGDEGAELYSRLWHAIRRTSCSCLFRGKPP